jgi:hypothetical protein
VTTDAAEGLSADPDRDPVTLDGSGDEAVLVDDAVAVQRCRSRLEHWSIEYGSRDPDPGHEA